MLNKHVCERICNNVCERMYNTSVYVKVLTDSDISHTPCVLRLHTIYMCYGTTLVSVQFTCTTYYVGLLQTI